MPIIVTTKGRPLSDLKLSSVDLMREVGLMARERILRRTASGLDEDDIPFRPYSLGYSKLKGEELGSARVNLQVSNGMLGAIQITEVTDKTVTLGFV